MQLPFSNQRLVGLWELVCCLAACASFHLHTAPLSSQTSDSPGTDTTGAQAAAGAATPFGHQGYPPGTLSILSGLPFWVHELSPRHPTAVQMGLIDVVTMALLVYLVPCYLSWQWTLQHELQVLAEQHAGLMAEVKQAAAVSNESGEDESSDSTQLEATDTEGRGPAAAAG